MASNPRGSWKFRHLDTYFNLSLDIVMIFVFCKRFFPCVFQELCLVGFFCHREMTVDQETGCNEVIVVVNFIFLYFLIQKLPVVGEQS